MNSFSAVLFGEYYVPDSPVCIVHCTYVLYKQGSLNGHSWKARFDFNVMNHVIILVLAKYEG
jgi:hypothetical protein